jgi:hypothetical protein
MLSFRPVFWLGLGIVIVTVGHVTGLVAEAWWDWDRNTGVLREFDLNNEGNLASWFESFLLLVAALLAFALTLVARAQLSPHARRWGVVAALLMLMTVDEAAQLHDMAAVPVRNALDLDGAFYFAWVIPAVIVAGIAAVYLLPLLLSLPVVEQVRLVIAAAVYFGGAVGVEMLSGIVVENGGRHTTPYHVVTTLEEVTELAGSLLVIAALLAILERTRPTVLVRVEDAKVVASALSDAVPAELHRHRATDR